MSKIPKNLTDKDMTAHYKEDPTLEDVFLQKSADKEASSKSNASDLQIAYLTPELVSELGKLLLTLKLDLYKEGIVDYKMQIKRVDSSIVLTPQIIKMERI